MYVFKCYLNSIFLNFLNLLPRLIDKHLVIPKYIKNFVNDKKLNYNFERNITVLNPESIKK